MRIGRTYVYERDSRKNNMATFGILSLIATGVAIFTGYKSVTLFSKYRDVSASLSSLIVHGTGYDGSFNPANTGDVVHVNLKQNELIFERPAYDPFMNVYVPNAVTLDRDVEYCQWQEHVHERTEKTGEHTERVTRTYTYTKGWRSHLINSLFFDQPAAHHNPQRNPVSSASVDYVGVSSVKGFSIPAYSMQNLRGPSSVISFGPQGLEGTKNSPGLENNFYYTGSDGWFLSKYDPSTSERLMKAAFQYAEGTLFDFQLGDLFSTCDAGDIRLRLEGKVLTNGISAIAEQASDGTLIPFKTLSGRDIMLLESGQVSAKEMIDNELSSQFWTLFWFCLGFVVCAVLLYVFASFFFAAVKAQQNENTKCE